MRELRAVALLIAYDGELPNDKLRSQLRRMGVSGREYDRDGLSQGSAPGAHARRVAAHLRAQGLVTVSGTGSGSLIKAAVSLTDLAAWLQARLAERDAALDAKAERTEEAASAAV
ncbi:hypothetical protein [Micromonospora sp. NPDC005652]|uniref:hypothetical protein n=1 Tax=Micromonospora sp. NPDC005652 TaxID=3157046 RepID=UPI0034024AE8